MLSPVRASSHCIPNGDLSDSLIADKAMFRNSPLMHSCVLHLRGPAGLNIVIPHNHRNP